MKILIITYYWPPSGGAGVQRWLKFVKYLPDFDIQPVVLTVDPQQAEYPVLDPSLEADIDPELEIYRTDCKGVYDLYKKFTGSKTSPYSGFANEGKPNILQKFARFIRGNFFLPDARRGWIKYAFAEACRIVEKYGIETVITTGPPHSTHLTGLKIKRKYVIKWIVDFRDPWTTIFYNDSLYQTRRAKCINQRLEQSVLDACDHLLLVSVDKEKLTIDSDKVTFLPNGFDPVDFDKKKSAFPKVFTICYTGTIAESYPTSQLLASLKLLKDDGAIFKIIFVGKVAESIKKNFNDCIENAVEFINYVSHAEAIDFMMSSHILLLLIPKTENNRHIMPGKIFEYLATGKTILVIGPDDSAVAQIVRQAKAGASFDYDDTEGINGFLKQQYQNYIKEIHPNPDMDVIAQFSRKRLTQRLAEIIG